MKLASILPVSYIDHTFDGQYAMLLAHLKDYYPKRTNKHCYTIMDNSLIELGGAVDIDTVHAAAEQCDADEMILPDVFRNGYETVQSAKRSIRVLRERGWLNKRKLMAVCQGKTENEFLQCFMALAEIPEIHCIGIPKVSAELCPGKGRPGLEYIWQGTSKCIHLLGVAKNLSELLEYKNPAVIRSVDTCIPALLSQTGHDAWVDRPETTIDLLEDKVNELNYVQIMLNLRKEGLV